MLACAQHSGQVRLLAAAQPAQPAAQERPSVWDSYLLRPLLCPVQVGPHPALGQLSLCCPLGTVSAGRDQSLLEKRGWCRKTATEVGRLERPTWFLPRGPGRAALLPTSGVYDPWRPAGAPRVQGLQEASGSMGISWVPMAAERVRQECWLCPGLLEPAGSTEQSFGMGPGLVSRRP